MKLLEDLKLKFPLKEFSPYGFCVVVPGAEFDPDCEAELVDHGYKCFDLDVDGEPVTLVRVVKTEKGSGEKTVYSPPAAPKASAEGEVHRPPSPFTGESKFWTPEEDKRLIELWNSDVAVLDMPEKFPGRKLAAITNRLGRLRKRGLLQKRYAGRKVVRGRGQDKRLEKESISVDTPVHTPVTLDKLASDVKGILDVLDVQGRVLDKLFCALLMQAVEVKQEKGDLSIPPGLWIHYANALLEEDKQYREKFRLKVEQLLEASE